MNSPEAPRISTLLVARCAAGLFLLPRRILLGLISVYQRTLSPILPAVFGPACGCRFYPTCSRYAAEAVATEGALRGAWLAAVRLLKCTPLHAGGFDPVPTRDHRKSRPSCTRIVA